MGDKVHPVTPESDHASEGVSTGSVMDRVHPHVTTNSDRISKDISELPGSEVADSSRFHPTAPPLAPNFEPLSPSGRSDATGYSQATSNFHPLKAFTAPGYASPPHPPPTVVGRPPLEPRPGARKPPHRRNACCCCLLVFFSVLLFLIFAVGMTALVLWLVYNPKLPHYTVQDVQIVKLNVTSPGNGTSNVGQPIVQNPVLNSDILFTIQAQNPNHKIGISYSRISIDGTYQGASVGQCGIPGFYQGVNNITTLSAELNVMNSQLTDAQGTALRTDISNSDVGLLGRVDVKVGMKIGSWTTPHVWIHVECSMQVSPPSSPQGAKLLSKSCHWKWK